MKNGFIHFCCHDSTQILEYDQGLLPYHAININNKQRKMLLLLVVVLTIILLLVFLPLIQERFNCIKYLGVRVSASKFDVNDGVSQSVP